MHQEDIIDCIHFDEFLSIVFDLRLNTHLNHKVAATKLFPILSLDKYSSTGSLAK
jgi:hypothetical protein